MNYKSPSEEPRFQWKCSYQGCVWYEVWDGTGIYEVELRRRADDYERKCYNGDAADWQRNVVDMIGVLHRAYNSSNEIPADTFRAFNAWLLADHNDHVAKIKSQPERYGADYEPTPPTLAKAAAVYRDGWQITARADEEKV